MADITDKITPTQLVDLRKNFLEDEMNAGLAAALPKVYPDSQPYVDAIAKMFTSPIPGPTPGDRERILIALLAAREERLNLAVHLYYAIGLGIPLREIVHILLLAGVYSGVPTFANALDVAADTFTLLAGLAAKAPRAADVLQELQAAFALPPP
jgi:alkylhydroperoxidase/carboxymuconolactone decarboxylase family protein YurZ